MSTSSPTRRPDGTAGVRAGGRGYPAHRVHNAVVAAWRGSTTCHHETRQEGLTVDLQVLGQVGRQYYHRGERVLRQPSAAEVADLLTELCTPYPDPRWW